MLEKYVSEDATQWAEYLPHIVFSYNITPILNLNSLSPYYLVFGQTPNLPIDNKLDLKGKHIDRIGSLKKVNDLREKIPKLIEKTQKAMKGQYDKSHANVSFSTGEKILKNERRK